MVGCPAVVVPFVEATIEARFTALVVAVGTTSWSEGAASVLPVPAMYICSEWSQKEIKAVSERERERERESHPSLHTW